MPAPGVQCCAGVVFVSFEGLFSYWAIVIVVSNSSQVYDSFFPAYTSQGGCYCLLGRVKILIFFKSCSKLSMDCMIVYCYQGVWAAEGLTWLLV